MSFELLRFIGAFARLVYRKENLLSIRHQSCMKFKAVDKWSTAVWFPVSYCTVSCDWVIALCCGCTVFFIFDCHHYLYLQIWCAVVCFLN